MKNNLFTSLKIKEKKMKKKLDRNFVVKIINQYADNYKLLEKENSNLKKEMIDLKSNLVVNKEIIESFFQKDEAKNTYLLYLNNLKNEMKLIEEKNAKLVNNNNELHNRLIKNDNIMNEYIIKKSDRTREFKNRIFILENIILKKNFVIENLKKKCSTLQETKEYQGEKAPKEIYITEPKEQLLILFNDLNLYKESYENLLKKIKGYKQEIENLKDKIREKNVSNMNNFTTKIIDEIIQKQTKKNWETDEWFAVLNYLNLNNKDIENNTHGNKFLSKILDAIELLNKILIKRNNRINELEKELEKIKENNKDLKNENLTLIKNVFKLESLNGKYGNIIKKKNKKYDASEQYINKNISMINNISLDNQESIQNFLKGLSFKSEDNDTSLEQSMVVENNISFFNKTHSISIDYSNMTLKNIPKNPNFTQSSDNFEINENDIFQKLNQNQLIKKNDSDENNIENKKIDDEAEKEIKHLNLNSDN